MLLAAKAIVFSFLLKKAIMVALFQNKNSPGSAGTLCSKNGFLETKLLRKELNNA